MSNQQSRREIISWVGAQVLPHEADARAWLYRLGTARHEVDDIVQEAYCRLAALNSVAHIANGRAYFFQTLRNIAHLRIDLVASEQGMKLQRIIAEARQLFVRQGFAETTIQNSAEWSCHFL